MKLSSAFLAATALVAVGSSSTVFAKPGDPGREKVVAAIKADHDASIDRLLALATELDAVMVYGHDRNQWKQFPHSPAEFSRA